MNQTYSWAEMLDNFRQLGGTAENIEQRTGAYGNGIFPIDPARPIEIEIPEHLLIDTNHVVLEGDDLMVSPDSGVPGEVCEFFTAYQRHFSWGAEGCKSAEAFESGLKQLPAPLLAKLSDLRLLDLVERHKGDWRRIVMRHFLHSRRIDFNGRMVSMPIIELVNHSAKSPGYRIKNTIKLDGKFDGEVTVNYNPTHDSLRRFLNYGFASPEPKAYSLPLLLKVEDALTIRIGYETAKTEVVDGLPLPKTESRGASRFLFHLMLGSATTPRVPRTVLRKTLSDIPIAKADELFDRARNANVTTLLDILELLDGCDIPLAREFRRALFLQLKALTYCYGARAA